MFRATRTRFALTLLIASLLASGCGARWLPSERTVYTKACAAIRAQAGVDKPVALAPIENCAMYINKNAARIDVPTTDGNPGAYVVWFKRIARTWEVHKLFHSSNPPPAG